MAEPIFFTSAQAFRNWLEANSAAATELLVGFHKVGTGQPSMTWSASVDEALCFGWIDGVRRRIDDATYSIRFTPRRPGSIWSAINIAKVTQLQLDGRMTPTGLAAFAKRTAAKSSIYSHEREHPAELTALELQTFKRNMAAWAFLEGTSGGYRKVVFHWVSSAKKPETRVARFGKLVDACAKGERLKQFSYK
jgi:uncharacterized protein YdeI (YjbR/CyaY-like superfamily)